MGPSSVIQPTLTDLSGVDKIIETHYSIIQYSSTKTEHYNLDEGRIYFRTFVFDCMPSECFCWCNFEIYKYNIMSLGGDRIISFHKLLRDLSHQNKMSC